MFYTLSEDRMKKQVVYLIFLIIFGVTGSVHAAPAYGTKMPQQQQVYLGGQTHWVDERDLEEGHGDMTSLQHFLLISYGITDWLTLDLKGGAGNTHQTPDGGDEISYPAYMAGGYGFRIRLYEQDAMKAVFGFQHISVHPYSVFVGNVKHKAVIDDWQLSFLGSYALKHFTPYAGARWSRMDYIHWTEDERDRVKSDLDRSFGIITGVDIPVHEKVWINVEGDFVDATAVTASLNFHF